MAFIDHVLEPPSYGWQDNEGNLIKPSNKQILREYASRINIFKTKKNWLPFFSWFCVLCLFPFFVGLIVIQVIDFNIWYLIAGFIYSMILMGTHGTIWLHRYCTHGAYTFKNKFWQIFTQNLVIKAIPEEVYVVSHHVHHAKSDQPGDPYNANAGFLYCFLADTNHQPIARNLCETDYEKAVNFMRHTGVPSNTYAAYQKYGSIASPLYTTISVALNWIFWYAAFYFMGGHGLAITIFGSAFFWAVGVRTFNFEGHGKGEDKRQDGVDYNRDDMSINQLWPGYVAGEWHNNHHLYPQSARSGFLPHQLDLAWVYIKGLHILGGITSYKDKKAQFLRDYRKPYLDQKAAAKRKPEKVAAK